MGGWNVALTAAILLSVHPPIRLSAQSLHVALGARYSTALVRDAIVSPIAVRPALGPLVIVTAALPLDHGWTAEALVHGGWAALRAEEDGRPATALGTARTIGAELALRRRLTGGGRGERGRRGGLTGRMGIGAFKYVARRTGIFRDGPPPVIPLWSTGLRYDPPAGWPRGLAIEARYDVHGLITPALRGVGFTSPRIVHRIALLLSLRVAGTPP
jgi:hypothetical protein